MKEMRPQPSHPIESAPLSSTKTWLASFILQRGQLLWQRVIHYYQRLQKLPRHARRLLNKKLALTALQAAFILALSGGPLFANNVAVTTVEHGINFGDGNCSLAEAIITANDTSTGDPFGADCNDADPAGPDTIILSGNTYNLDYAYDTTYGNTALPLINSNVTIEGNGATFERDGMADPFRIMAVGSGGDLTLDNLTISGGYASGMGSGSYGGGIYGYEASITITNTSVIAGNMALEDGGGISNFNPTGDANISIINSQITGNISGDDGGGVYNYSVFNTANLTIQSSLISGNSANDDGGGTGNGNYDGSSVQSVTDSIISNNYAGDDGGGLNNYARYGTATLTVSNSSVSNNDAVENGGGIYSYSYSNIASVTIQQNSRISTNDSYTRSGGGIYNHSHLGATSLVIEGSTISDNNANRLGGGIRNFSYGNATSTINNSTISGNSALLPGGGIENYSYNATATVTITNTSIISGNIGIVGGGVANYSYYGAANITINNSTISGNNAVSPGGGIYNGGNTGTTITVQNNSTISNNESYNAVGGGIFNYGYTTGDIIIDNSIINDNMAAYGGGGIYNRAITDASLTIQINAEIRDNIVSSGSMQMDKITNHADNTNHHSGNSSQTEDRRWATIETSVVSGDTRPRGGYWESNKDIDNPIITRVEDDGIGAGYGGGLANYSETGIATMTIQDGAVIRDNVTAEGRGGGAWNFSYNGDASTQVEQSTITDNSSYLTSGGIENWSRYGNASLNIDASTISGNDTDLVGGGVANYSNGGTATTLITNTTIANNLANEYGGGIYNGANDSPALLTIENSTISGNSAQVNGGGIYNISLGVGGATSTIHNSTISGNTAVNGGGIYNPNGTTTNLTHVTIYNNEATGNGGGIANAGGTVNATNSIIAGSTAGTDCYGGLTTGGYNLDSDGSCVIAGSDITSSNPNLGPLQLNAPGSTATHALRPGSTAIDVIPNGVNGCGITLLIDQRGSPRPIDANDDGIDACDIGAFESGIIFQNLLPIIMNNYAAPTDLTITNFYMMNGNVFVTIKNQGKGAISDDFWVDLYLNPNPIPTGANDVWELLSTYGAAWGVTEPLSPGQSLTLSLNDTYYVAAKSNMPATIPSGTVLYAQVDSANTNTNYGAVLESDEANNITSGLTAP
ncbi:MAG: hypothetical protein GY943_10890 [Chloroflexi bacterium]|nr:hypothetical protein [Chloroflexota bacterium]